MWIGLALILGQGLFGWLVLKGMERHGKGFGSFTEAAKNAADSNVAASKSNMLVMQRYEEMIRTLGQMHDTKLLDADLVAARAANFVHEDRESA